MVYSKKGHPHFNYKLMIFHNIFSNITISYFRKLASPLTEIKSMTQKKKYTMVIHSQIHPPQNIMKMSNYMNCDIKSIIKYLWQTSVIVWQKIKQKGFAIPTPKQSSIYKATYRHANELKETMKTELKEDAYALHFDSKKVGNR